MSETAATPQAPPTTATDASKLAERACIFGVVSLAIPLFAFVSISLARRALQQGKVTAVRDEALISAAFTLSCTSLFTWVIVAAVLAYK